MINSKYEVAELCQKLKLKTESQLQTKKLNIYQKAKLRGQIEAYDLIIQHILNKSDD